ncbi:MAG: hypothetical protein MZV65_18520 [Chromatiales bacterium]|nr:hypothetical protein [Chromatiales bacterium]
MAIGYPGRVVEDRVVTEPRNLAPGWVGFDFAAAFGRPVKVINDAAMQALGSYQGGTMLFLGLGTGLGSALMVQWAHRADGARSPLLRERAPSRTTWVFAGSRSTGRRSGARLVELLVARFTSALLLDDVVIGGGNAKKLEGNCRRDVDWAATPSRLWEDIACGSR